MFRYQVVPRVAKSSSGGGAVDRRSARQPYRPYRRLFLEGLEDRRLLAVINVTPAGLASTPTDNDYTRIAAAVDSAISGDTINLAGTFDWTEPNAAASWALGNDATPGTDDDYAVQVPANLDNVTLTAASLGAATIQGPGDLASFDQEAFLLFWTPSLFATNQDWTISNLRINNFDLGIGMFFAANGQQFSGTTITNNHIQVAEDTTDDTQQNIGIHFSFGQDQVISSNIIDLSGGGLSDSSNNNFAASVGMQSNTGNNYDGLQIDNNTINVLNAQSSDPEGIVGIWENGHAHTSNITISNNDFNNLAAGNNPALNLQRGFRVTSHSSATTAVTYSANTVSGANIGIQWISSGVGGFTDPVNISGNSLVDVFTGILVQAGGAATITGNTINGLLSGGAGVKVAGSSSRATIVGNTIGGSFDGVDVNGAAALIQANNLNGNADAGLLIQGGGIVDAGQAGAGTNFTGLGISSGGNNFAAYNNSGRAYGSPLAAIKNLNVDAAAGSQGAPPDVMAQNNTFFNPNPASIEKVVDHDVDVATTGFVNFNAAVQVVTDPCDGTKLAILINGTSDSDHITFNRVKNSNMIEVTIKTKGSTSSFTFSDTAYNRIIVHGNAGDDHIDVDSKIAIDAWLFGESGKDHLKGGSGNNIVSGGDGDDHLQAGDGRDLLIGGQGSDHLKGKGNDDILIAGFTDHDTNDSALCAIMDEWTSANSFDTRRTNLSALLNPATVHDDGDKDDLQGDTGRDWIFANVTGGGTKDKVHERNDDFVTDI